MTSFHVHKFENAGCRVMTKELEDVETKIKEEEETYLSKFANIILVWMFQIHKN